VNGAKQSSNHTKKLSFFVSGDGAQALAAGCRAAHAPRRDAVLCIKWGQSYLTPFLIHNTGTEIFMNGIVTNPKAAEYRRLQHRKLAA